jgi:hypothetical protein
VSGTMIEMLSGALLFSYAIAGVHFLRFWKRTGDRLFVHFAIAFWLLALNQLATSTPVVADETLGYEYLLRFLGFIVIIAGIIDTNVASPGRSQTRNQARKTQGAGPRIFR